MIPSIVANALPTPLLLLQRYGSLRSDQLTVDVLRDVVGAFGVQKQLSPHVTEQVVELLRKDDIDTLADLAGNPAALQQLIAFVKGLPDDSASAATDDANSGAVKACRFCGKFNLYKEL